MKLPTRIILTSGIGTRLTKLNDFDSALLNAGIENFNLLQVSSIIPPKAEIIYLTMGRQENYYLKLEQWYQRFIVIFLRRRSRNKSCSYFRVRHSYKLQET